MNEQQLIKSKIHEIRGQKVMLDFDLAELYRVETKYLKRSVKRNIDRFEGEDFMFQLTKEEVTEFSRFHFGTLNKGRGYNLKYAPFAFTELGVAMLSSVLNSVSAIAINRGIMRAFVSIRQMTINTPTDRIAVLEDRIIALKQYIEEVFTDYNDINEDTRMQLELINRTLAEMQVEKESKPRKPIGFKSYD
jgi:hypothetical protein